MNAKKIPVVKVGQSGVTGTVEDFEGHFAKRRKGSGQPASTPRPKLQAIKNPSMQERIEELNLGEEVR